MTPDLDALRDYLALISSDDAMMDSFRHARPDLVDLFKAVVGEPQKPFVPIACPDLTTLDAWQVTVFDNWRDGDKRGKRYGANLRAWSHPISWTQPTWEAAVKFWDAGKASAREAAKLTKANLKSPLNASTVELLEDLAKADYTHVGVAKRQVFGEGTTYFNDHVVGLALRNGKPERVDFYNPGNGAKAATCFSSLDGQGKALTGNAFAQARVSDDVSLATWTTK